MAFDESVLRKIRGSELEGKTCGICRRAFEPRILDHEGAYMALRNLAFLRKGEIYHLFCLKTLLASENYR